MGSLDEAERDLSLIQLPEAVARVVAGDDQVPWQLVDQRGDVIQPVRAYLRDLMAKASSERTIRTYAFALERWWRFLAAVDVRWDQATSGETRDLVLWLLHYAKKPVAGRRVESAKTAGTVNPITRKPYQDDKYRVTTIRQSNTVLRGFYDFWLDRGRGPIVNPVPLGRSRGRRPNAHHNFMAPFRPEGKLRYNPPLPKKKPRAIPDPMWDALFASMPSNRDRAILALAVSTGARAFELLCMRGADIDWGDQLIQVRRKGTRALQWLPASDDAFVWLRLYLSEVGEPGPADPVWVTLRRRSRNGGPPARQPLTYDAWRAELRRANKRLGTNWSMHDLRHTASIRMVQDKENLSLRDVQEILGHASLSTTAVYLVDDEDHVIRRVRQHLDHMASRERNRLTPVATGYDPADLEVLFGRAVR
jgi:integrase/recombinase XerD